MTAFLPLKVPQSALTSHSFHSQFPFIQVICQNTSRGDALNATAFLHISSSVSPLKSTVTSLCSSYSFHYLPCTDVHPQHSRKGITSTGFFIFFESLDQVVRLLCLMLGRVFRSPGTPCQLSSHSKAL